MRVASLDSHFRARYTRAKTPIAQEHSGASMRVERLRFTDFRNYRELDLALPDGLVVLQGRNAQGKSNILEAIGLIATSRSFRTSSEREAVRWGATGRFARVEATVARDTDTLTVEVVVADPQATIPGETPSATPAPMPPGAP